MSISSSIYNQIYRRISMFFCLTMSLSYITASETSPAYGFLDIPSSTRVYGLGGVNITTIDDDINLIGQNPALLGPEFENQLGINYMHYVGGSNFAGICYGNRATDHSAWAVGLQYFGYGSMKMTDEAGNIHGTFSPKDVAFSGTYSHDISDRLRGGATVKMLYSAYAEYNAFALATDIGINYFNPDNDLSLSATVMNLGGQVKRFTETYERLPIDVRLGWSQSFGTLPIRLSVTAWRLTQWSSPRYDPGDGGDAAQPELKESFGSNLFRHLVFGAEVIPNDKFHIGIGYNYRTRTDMSTYSRSFLSGFSLGAGIRLKSFGIGVAFAQPHTGATTLMFNLTTRFSDLIR